MKIRQAAKEDMAFCTELSTKLDLLCPDGTKISQRYFEEVLAEGAIFLVAEQEDTLLGYVLGEPLMGNGALLNIIGVDSDKQASGVGTALVAEFEKVCKSKGFTWIILYALSKDERVLYFYRKNGYVGGKQIVDFMKEM